MVKGIGRVIEINVRTKERKEYEKEFDFSDEPYVEPIGIDLDKLKQVLLKEQIIKDVKELEPDAEPIVEPIT